jgi:hypothetical protein
MVGGRLIVDDGVIQTVDESAILAEAAEVSRHLLRRNSDYAELAGAQEAFLTRVSTDAGPPREVIPFRRTSQRNSAL